jgi:hypothetical protein
MRTFRHFTNNVKQQSFKAAAHNPLNSLLALPKLSENSRSFEHPCQRSKSTQRSALSTSLKESVSTNSQEPKDDFSQHLSSNRSSSDKNHKNFSISLADHSSLEQKSDSISNAEDCSSIYNLSEHNTTGVDNILDSLFADCPEEPVLLGKRKGGAQPLDDAYKRQKTDSDRLSVLEKAQSLAHKLGATLVSRGSLSISHGQTSVRFTCVNEHNFFLSCDTVN